MKGKAKSNAEAEPDVILERPLHFRNSCIHFLLAGFSGHRIHGEKIQNGDMLKLLEGPSNQFWEMCLCT